jgi:carbamoyltransferase
MAIAAGVCDGLALGAAYWAWHNVIKGKDRFHMQHAFWGPEYSDAHIHSVVKSSPYGFAHYIDRQCLVDSVARHIADGKIVGWYQGRSEWGPRALGNRSILANPLIPTMKDTINTKIKRRESFRPFAPSVLEELVAEYFEQTVSSPFMMHVVKLRKYWQDRLHAVTHVDGTGRLQSVSYSMNPLYYDLITAFRRITGVGIVLNTSFNENEPIVDTPEQAYDCFARTDMDVLCMGSYVLMKG